MALHYKTCTIQYAAKTDGTPATGYVEFKPNTVLTETDTGIILNDYAIVGYLDETGKVTVSLLVCDSPGVEPTGWSWNIEEKIDGGSVWWFQIFDSMEEPINLKDLYIPGSVPPTVAVQGPKGDTGDKGDKGDTGPQGPEGPEGQAAVIVGNFDRDPADLPPDGYVPANWDSPGKPPADTQILVGQAFLYNPNGHLWSFVGQTVVVAGWQDIGMIVGPQGEKGETGPLSPEDIIAGANITVVINANDTVTISAPTPVVDHGNLQGLADDDHTQYHNNTRGDARYDSKGTANSAVAAHVAAADPHTQYLTADDVIPPEIAVVNDAPAAESITLWIDPDAPDYSGVALSDLDARYVNVAGDTMTGRLTLPQILMGDNVLMGADDINGLLIYNEDASALENVTCADPTSISHAATKRYVDSKVLGGEIPVNYGAVEAGSSLTYAVVFPVAFASPPQVVANLRHSVTLGTGYNNPGYGTSRVGILVSGITNQGCQITVSFDVATETSSATSLNWVAVGIVA